jgi:hypothetical protein
MRTKYFLAEGSSTVMQKSPLKRTAESSPAGFANEILKSQANDHIAKNPQSIVAEWFSVWSRF